MRREYEIRPIREGDEEGLNDLYRHVFSGKASKEYWRWKYFDNPAGIAAAAVALTDGKIIGNCASIPMKVKIGKEEITASQSVDAAVMPEYRKGTPFFKLSYMILGENEARNYHFMCGFSKEITHKIAIKRLGFSEAGAMYKLVKIINPAPFLKRGGKLKNFARPLGFLGFWGIKLLTKPAIASSKEFTINKIRRFDREFDELWKRRSEDFPIMTVRDSKYLNWRFVDCPNEKFDKFAAYKNGLLTGYIILSIRREKIGEGIYINRGFIIDLLAPPDDEAFLKYLLANALDYFYENKADNITAWFLKHTSVYKLLKNVLFMVRDIPRFMNVKPFNGNCSREYLSDRNNWYLTLGDADTY